MAFLTPVSVKMFRETALEILVFQRGATDSARGFFGPAVTIPTKHRRVTNLTGIFLNMIDKNEPDTTYHRHLLRLEGFISGGAYNGLPNAGLE